ncbi:MAG: hypothetical protein ACK559_10230, partial [bacterium]
DHAVQLDGEAVFERDLVAAHRLGGHAPGGLGGPAGDHAPDAGDLAGDHLPADLRAELEHLGGHVARGADAHLALGVGEAGLQLGRDGLAAGAGEGLDRDLADPLDQRGRGGDLDDVEA